MPKGSAIQPVKAYLNPKVPQLTSEHKKGPKPSTGATLAHRLDTLCEQYSEKKLDKFMQRLLDANLFQTPYIRERIISAYKKKTGALPRQNYKQSGCPNFYEKLRHAKNQEAK